MQKAVKGVGIGCILLVIASLVPAFTLHCVQGALRVGTPSLFAGILLGSLMAAITRLRRPTYIYLGVVGCVLTLWPLYHAWPGIRLEDVIETSGPMSRAIMYLEAVRPIVFILGIPFPYSWLGQHRADTPELHVDIEG